MEGAERRRTGGGGKEDSFEDGPIEKKTGYFNTEICYKPSNFMEINNHF